MGLLPLFHYTQGPMLRIMGNCKERALLKAWGQRHWPYWQQALRGRVALWTPRGHIAWLQSLVVTLGILLRHSVPLFPHLSKGDDSGTYFIRSSGRLKELTCLNYLAQCLAQNKPFDNVNFISIYCMLTLCQALSLLILGSDTVPALHMKRL